MCGCNLENLPLSKYCNFPIFVRTIFASTSLWPIVFPFPFSPVCVRPLELRPKESEEDEDEDEAEAMEKADVGVVVKGAVEGGVWRRRPLLRTGLLWKIGLLIIPYA